MKSNHAYLNPLYTFDIDCAVYGIDIYDSGKDDNESFVLIGDWYGNIHKLFLKSNGEFSKPEQILGPIHSGHNEENRAAFLKIIDVNTFYSSNSAQDLQLYKDGDLKQVTSTDNDYSFEYLIHFGGKIYQFLFHSETKAFKMIVVEGDAEL
jgi:hypothetical protein